MCKRRMPNSQIQIVRDTHSLIAWEEWGFIDKVTKFVWQWSHSALNKVSGAVIFVFNHTNLHQVLCEFTPCNHYNGPITTTPTIATQFQTLQQIKTLAFSITVPSHAAPMDTLHICHPYNHSVSSTFEIVHILQTLKPLERPDKYMLQILCCWIATPRSTLANRLGSRVTKNG